MEKLQVIPAHAGVIPHGECRARHGRRYSRTRGGDPKIDLSFRQEESLFPHTRG